MIYLLKFRLTTMKFNMGRKYGFFRPHFLVSQQTCPSPRAPRTRGLRRILSQDVGLPPAVHNVTVGEEHPECGEGQSVLCFQMKIPAGKEKRRQILVPLGPWANLVKSPWHRLNIAANTRVVSTRLREKWAAGRRGHRCAGRREASPVPSSPTGAARRVPVTHPRLSVLSSAGRPPGFT